MNLPGPACVWYGLLFAVCEGIKDKGITIPGVQSEIDRIYDPLKRFRSAVSHPQEKYWSRKLLEFVEGDGNATLAHKVHKEVGDWIIGEMNKRNPDPKNGIQILPS